MQVAFSKYSTTLIEMVQSWIILIWICNAIMWETCDSLYPPGYTERILRTISRITWELVIDATSKVVLVESFKSSYANQRVFQYGDMVYKIRRNLKRMVILYRQALEVIELGNKDEEKDVGKLIEVERLGREIDHFVAMIELSRKNSRKPIPRIGRALRSYESKILRTLMESENFDIDPKPPPSVIERSGKKINKKWHYTAIDEFEK